ncbi:(R S)-reticuline 7-O-methyltransferase [Bienertia sinuspersici]
MVYNHLFAYTETLTLRSAIELRIADIIHSHGGPMSISQIASKIEAPSPHIGWLERVMRMLVRKQIFSINNDEGDNDEVLYGLTTTSKWLLHDQESSLAPMFLTLSDHTLVKPWFEISRSIKDGDESAFVKAHGESMWEMLAHNHEFKNMFNSGMANLNKPIFDAIFKFYKEGFSKLEGSIIDVGGASGKLVAAIVEAYPHIKGINFDLPHVVAKAPQYPGVVHVGGDMFQEVPCADNVIMKVG